jgi:hypothetical protein
LILRFLFAIGFLVALGTCIWWAPLVGLTPPQGFAYTIIAACALWLAAHVIEFIGICMTGGR